MNKTLGALTLGALLALTGCEQEGPLERAGEDLDEAMEEMAEGLERNEGPAERAGERIDEAMEEMGERMERAGEEIQAGTSG